MRNFISVVATLLIVALAYYYASAAGYSVSISWEYPNPPSDLAGFHLFVNGKQVQDFQVPTARSWAGPLDLNEGDNTVGLTAYDESGNESTPAEITVNPPPPSPQSLELHF